MMVHLQGMGVIGCYLALRFDREGIPFTWSDCDIRVNAWRACTGAIFPTGDFDDLHALNVWHRHRFEPGFSPFMEAAEYVFCTDSPPHGGKYGWEPVGDTAKRAELVSLHLNVQSWVPATRRRFADRRTIGPARGDQLVIAHGFGPRLERFMWGWTMPVKLTTADEGSLRQRQALYFRRGRFVMAYAYPIPGQDTWYAGSSLISQQRPKPLEIEPKFKRWREQFLMLGAGYVRGVSRAGAPLQGWRPVPAKEDTEWVTRQADGTLVVRPLWHSGVRHAPLIAEALLGPPNVLDDGERVDVTDPGVVPHEGGSHV